KWMMWKTIQWAKDEGLSSVYLGTCYGTKSLYKVRDHLGLSFFDGYKWNTDMTLLKSLCKSDEDSSMADQLKRADEPNDYLKTLLQLS
ncbi:MAG: hypothetical protein OEQ53_02095, partial [Saprospiraceae bacterium]|nr:hypothetical protein [Saprospiraceae bacterium]